MLILFCFFWLNFIILLNIWNNMWGKCYFRFIVVELMFLIGFDVEIYIFNDDLWIILICVFVVIVIIWISYF